MQQDPPTPSPLAPSPADAEGHRVPMQASDLSHPVRPLRRHLPAAVFLAAAGYLFLRSYVYVAPRSVHLSNLPLQRLDGNPLPTAQLQGKAVVLNFWAPWCPPCREEMPWLEDLQRKHPEITVIGVETDPQVYGEAQALARQLGLTYLLVQQSGTVRQHLGDVAALPTTLYISPSGRVVHTATGATRESVMQLYLADTIAAR